MTPYPAHWRPGMLLDLKRYSDGHFEATLLGERAEADGSNVVRFESSYDAQQFTSAWYGTPEMRAQIYPINSPQGECPTGDYESAGTGAERQAGKSPAPILNRAERRKLRLGKT